MANYKADLIEKIDEIFGFNLSNNIDNVDYNFGQYKLNQLYKPLVKHFVNEFSKFLDGQDASDSNQIISLFVDFFKLYFFQGDFGYFKSKYSSFNYKIPYGMNYSGKDTEFWRASKDCYYVKTSDVVNNMDIQVPTADLSVKDIRLQFFKEKKFNDEGKILPLDVKIEIIDDGENDELLGYNIYIFNYDEDTTSKTAKEKFVLDKIQDFGIQITPGIKNTLSEFLSKRGRDFFIHKRLRDFLKGELERYLFQVMKGDTQGRIDVLSVENKIEEIKKKYEGDNEYIEYQIAKIYSENTKDSNPTIYQNAYARIYNFINILGDFEEFKSKLWNKKRKVVKQEYCISLGKIEEFETLIPAKNEMFGEILNNEEQLKNWENELKTEKYLDKISIDIIKSELSSGTINLTKNLVVDTNYFKKDSKLYETLSSRGDKKLYEDGEKLDGIMIKSENYQGLNTLTDNYREKIQGTYIDPPFNLGENGDFLYKTDYLDGSWASMLTDRISISKTLLNNTSSYWGRCDYNGNYILRDVMDEIFGNDNLRNEIILAKSNRIKTKGRKFLSWHDTLFLYSVNFEHQKFEHIKMKREEQGWRQMDNDGEVRAKIPNEIVPLLSPENIKYDKNGNPTSRARIILGKEILPPDGRRFPSQEQIREMEKLGNIRLSKNGNPQITKSDDIFLTDNWTDVIGYSSSTGFPTENAEVILYRCLTSTTDKGDIFMDYFAGSATTQAVAQKLGRKWIGIELGGQFERYDLPRLRATLQGKESQISKEGEVDYKGGGFFTYLYLNQYEDRFSVDGYLTKLEDEIVELRDLNIDDNTKISQILSPLNELKEHIYNIDDELSNDELQAMSRMIHE